MTKFAILISGRGSNMEAICQRLQAGDLKGELVFIASDKDDAPGIKRAAEMGYRTDILPYAEQDKSSAEDILRDMLKEEKAEYLVLAGFMKVLTARFVNTFPGKIVNIHPSLLPSFPGTRSIRDAWDYGVKITGVTVHLVDEKIDHGPILAQSCVRIEDHDTLESLEEKIHKTEHNLYWRTLDSLFGRKLQFKTRRNCNGT